MNILIVEDEDVTRQLLEQSLQFLGYEVRAVDNAADALDVLRTTDTRLVMTDWVMPGMSGLELCQTIRNEQFDGYVYVLMLTSKDATRDVIEAYSAGADDYIAKPFEPAELSARLRTAHRILSLETRDMTIFALAKLAESRDPETGRHLERVRSYSRVLAEDLARQDSFASQITLQFIRLIYQTSPLHDIGKVAIPDHVLLKPGRLDDREYEIMKTHVDNGVRTLELALEKYPDAAFLRMARDIARYHHEKVNGQGYPEGLAGEDIPLAARIFALADVYDALTSRRVYKAAYTHDVARSIILKDRGEHFDSDVVDAFERCQDAFQQIATEIADTPTETAERCA